MSSALFFFFFSSRRRHTRWTGDWSSDVCSSDLIRLLERRELDERRAVREGVRHLVRERQREPALPAAAGAGERNRSEERRVGKSVDLGGRRIIKKKKIRSIERIGVTERGEETCK